MTIVENGKDYQTPLIFSGKGKKINNCISWYNSTFEKVRWGKGNLPDLTVDQFFNRLDSLKDISADLKKYYKDSVLTDNEITLLDNKSKFQILSFEQEYYFLRYNYSIYQKSEALKSGGNYETKIGFTPNDVPLDTSFLAYSDYQRMLIFYWHNKVNLQTSELLIGSNDKYYLAPQISDSLIKTNKFPAGMREYVTAYNLNYWLNAYGITPVTDSVFADFKQTYIDSKYLPLLNTTYKSWLAVAPGSPAPDLEGTTLEGKRISLKDLKGKMIYMDVWATSCRPCVAEIPFSKKLQQQFSNEETIQFVNVSIDSDRSAWEKLLNNDKTWKGRHMIIDSEKIQEFYKNYKLFGIPSYILIDSSGKIIDIKAPRPSDKTINDIIRKLINERK